MTKVADSCRKCYIFVFLKQWRVKTTCVKNMCWLPQQNFTSGSRFNPTGSSLAAQHPTACETGAAVQRTRNNFKGWSLGSDFYFNNHQTYWILHWIYIYIGFFQVSFDFLLCFFVQKCCFWGPDHVAGTTSFGQRCARPLSLARCGGTQNLMATI